VLDYERLFKESVIDDFTDTYLAGETPIPCVRCNQTVKFRDLLGTARDLGASALATGHYVRRVEGPAGPELHQAKDAGRDQSYFLFATTREQLAYLRFPLGGMDKAETRRHAERLRLPVAAKPDSQDICFVPNGSYARVVERLRPGMSEPGEVVDLAGRVLGRHDGIIHFTIGQRRGLGLGHEISGGEPLYVARLEPERRRVVVGPWSALLKARLLAREVNWLGARLLPGHDLRVQVKVRSTQPAATAVLRAIDGNRAEVLFDQPQAGIAPGQACVFYDGERVLGGGWIARHGGAVG
jgi:tRNA-specific 2-thiouridylase